MNQFMKNNLALAFCVSLLVSGCTPQGNGILGKTEDTTSLEDVNIKNAPFAYDIIPDTISYNSCTSSTLPSNSVLHGLKIGVSGGFADNLGTGDVKSGLKLKTAFINYVGQKFSPEYPNNTIQASQVQRILNKNYSVFNANAHLQFAVRKKADYKVVPALIFPNSAPASSSNGDFVAFEQNLGSGYLGYTLTKNIQFNNSGTPVIYGPLVYNLSESQDAIPIEASFGFNQVSDSSGQICNATNDSQDPDFILNGCAERYSQSVRNAFNSNTQFLAATFGGTQDVSANTGGNLGNTIDDIKRPYARSSSSTGDPTFDQTKAFGRGYYLKFDNQSSVASWPKNRLTQVSEIDLETGSPVGSSWSCEQYIIARQDHWNNNKAENPDWKYRKNNYLEPNCAPLLSEDITCSVLDSPSECVIKTQRAERIKRLRRHYSESNWNIGLMMIGGFNKFQNSLKSNYSPATVGNRRIDQELCLSPKNTDVKCYLETKGILLSSADANVDVGIQYDRTQECYLSSVGGIDNVRKNGRCANFASLCVRTN